MYVLSSSPMAGTRRVLLSAFPAFPYTSPCAGSRAPLRDTVKAGRRHAASDPSPGPVSALPQYSRKENSSLSERSLTSSECLFPGFLVQHSLALSTPRRFLSGSTSAPPRPVRRRRESLTSLRGCHGIDSSALAPLFSSSSSSSPLPFSGTGFPYHNGMHSACAALTGEFSRHLAQPLISFCLGSRGRQRHLSSSTSNSSTSSPSTPFASSSASPGLPPRFRSAVHREMVVSVTRTHLQNLLLRRFGRNVHEKEILGGKSGLDVLALPVCPLTDTMLGLLATSCVLFRSPECLVRFSCTSVVAVPFLNYWLLLYVYVRIHSRGLVHGTRISVQLCLPARAIREDPERSSLALYHS